MRAAQRGEEEGTILVAECQTAGRGRGGRTWVSPPRVNIYFSVILRPPLPLEKLSLVTFTAAISVVRAVRGETGLFCALKWPNDVLLNGKKVGGILAELTRGVLILGVGVNVNMDTSLLPKEIRSHATSLREQCGLPINRALLLTTILHELDVWYMVLLSGGERRIRNTYKGLSDTLGRWLSISFPDRTIEGLALDIAETGALIVRKKDGSQERVSAGEALYVRPVLPCS